LITRIVSCNWNKTGLMKVTSMNDLRVIFDIKLILEEMCKQEG